MDRSCGGGGDELWGRVDVGGLGASTGRVMTFIYLEVLARIWRGRRGRCRFLADGLEDRSQPGARSSPHRARHFAAASQPSSPSVSSRAGPAAVRTTSPASDTRAIGDETSDVLCRRRDAAVAGPGPARAASGTGMCCWSCWQRACMAAASVKYSDNAPSQLMYGQHGRPRARSMCGGYDTVPRQAACF